jgi:hypothetical protein
MMEHAMDEEAVLDEWFKLEFSIRRSMRYNLRRRAFFEFWHRMTSASAVLFGSATLTSLFANLPMHYTASAAVVVTVLGGFDLVIGLASHAWTHADIARRFIELEKQMIAVTPSEAELRRLTGARLDIERDEPPVLNVLNVICHNDVCLAQGLHADIVPLTWMQRQLANFTDIGLHKLRPRRDDQAPA